MRPVRAHLGKLSAAAVALLVVLFLVGLVRPPLYTYEPVAWSDSTLLNGGRTLRVMIMHGACDLGGTIEARMTDTEVEVRTSIKDRRLPTGPVWTWREQACITLGVYDYVEVRLRDPMGKRMAYDPVSGNREVPATGG